MKKATADKTRSEEGQSCRLSFACVLAAIAATVSGCSRSAQSQIPAPSPPEVSVAEIVCRQLDDTNEFTGRLESVHVVEVRPRVSGYLQKVYFKEGAIVQLGDLLFEIDPRPFQAEVDRLQGDLAQAEAELSRAQSDFQRAERLHDNNGIVHGRVRPARSREDFIERAH
jgi:membrane fusion protein, multidrug efflux system